MLTFVALTALGVVVRAPPPCMMALPSWVPAERIGEIQEPAAQAAFDTMQTVEVGATSSRAFLPYHC